MSALLVDLRAANNEPVLAIDFGDYAEGPVEGWLQTKGFVFERDAKRRDRIDLDIDDRGLVIETKRRALGLMPNEAVNVPEFSTIEIDWGVTLFPAGASYDEGIRNEALMVIIFLGDERLPSGSMFIPDSPHFIGLFLCNDEKVGHPYVGQYFKKGGRYVCLERPAPGAAVTSTFDLLGAYRQFFDKEGDDDPAISGIALAVDTTKSSEGGRAGAFIKRISFH